MKPSPTLHKRRTSDAVQKRRRADAHHPLWRSERHRKWVIEAGRFSATVFCAALLAIWLPKVWRGFTTSVSRTLTTDKRDALVHESHRPVPVGKMEDLYRKHLEEIFHSLEAHGSITILKLPLPATLLQYQQNRATTEGGKALQLQGMATTVPFVAVSSEAKKFLDSMLVTYVDPHNLPPQFIPDKYLPFKSSLIMQFVLIPDLSGDNAAYFTFGNDSE